MVKCREDLFQSDFEKRYFQEFVVNEHVYCVDDKEIHLKGTRDDAVDKIDHAYLIYNVARCINEERDLTLMANGQTVDPECALEHEIDEWTMTKKT